MFTSTTRRYPDGTPRTKHVTTNLIMEIDDEAGHGHLPVVLHRAPGRAGTAAAADRGRPLPRPLRAGRVDVAVRRAPLLHRPGRRREPAPTGAPPLHRLTHRARPAGRPGDPRTLTAAAATPTFGPRPPGSGRTTVHRTGHGRRRGNGDGTTRGNGRGGDRARRRASGRPPPSAWPPRAPPWPPSTSPTGVDYVLDVRDEAAVRDAFADVVGTARPARLGGPLRRRGRRRAGPPGRGVASGTGWSTST